MKDQMPQGVHILTYHLSTVLIPRLQADKDAPIPRKCTCAAQFIRYALDAICVDLRLPGILQCSESSTKVRKYILQSKSIQVFARLCPRTGVLAIYLCKRVRQSQLLQTEASG